MTEIMQNPYKPEQINQILNPIVEKWFFTKFKEYSLPQLYGVMEIHSRNNILISAPTGATKTLTGFLSILNELIDSSEKGILEDKIYCAYISPLRALSEDIKVNLINPLKEMEEIAGKKLNVRVAVRTGDTTPAEKSKQLVKPPHILITTPESLAIVLSSIKFVELLKDVQWCIVDEVHALAENKRGTHLSLSLERLQKLSPAMTRIGLSATIAPLDEIAKYLVGYEDKNERPCKIVDVQFIKKLDLKVLSPIPDLIDTEHGSMHQSMYSLMHHLIQEHKTTLIFTNTRSATERVVHNLKDKFPKFYNENIGAHHGSLSKTHRHSLENRLREGKIKVVVCLEGNTEILNENGEWKKIKDIKGGNLQTLNKNLKLSSNKIKNTFKLKNNGSLLKLKSEFGKEIICTKDHKFLTIENGKLFWKTADNLKNDDFVATIRKYNYKTLGKNELKRFTFDNFPDEYFVNLNKNFLSKRRQTIKKNFRSYSNLWKKHFSSFYSYSSFKSNLNGIYSFKIKYFKKLIEILKIGKIKAFDHIISVTSDKYKMPKIVINEDLMRLLGFMSAEGYISKRDLMISNRNKDLLVYYGNLITKLSNKKPFSKLSSSGTPILVWTSAFLCKFLENIGFKIGRKSRINAIPSFIFRLDSNLLFSFLSGYLDGDGYAETKKDGRTYAIGICTTSKEMAKDLHKLLIREGILASIRSSYYDEVQTFRGRNIIKKGWFYAVVILGGENLREFLVKANPIRKNLRMAKKIIIQKIGLDTIKYELQNFKNLSCSDIFWQKIKSKEEVKNIQEVYTLEVSNDHNYIANGFITQNCSTSLELGIDIGYIDLVICLSSPKSVARALQRIGRSGHKLHDTTKGRIIVLDRDDLVECAVLLKSAIEKKIDKIHIPTNALDVLAQQIYGIAIQEKININDLFKLIKNSYCYHNLERNDFMEIIDYLAGKYISLEDRHIYAKIWHDEETGMIGRRGKLARVLYMTNIGTIPDETSVKVKVGEQFVGTIEEAFLERLRPGDVFVLGGQIYEFKFARGMVAQVSASANRPPNVPSWFSEMLPLSFDLALEIGRFRKLLNEMFCAGKRKEEIINFINDFVYVDANAADSIYNYFNEQFHYAEIPSNTRIIVEHYTNEQGIKHTIFHTLYGRRVNDCLSRALAFAISRTQHRDVEIGINDNGFYIASEKSVNVMHAFKLIKSSEFRKVLDAAIDRTEVLKRRFRHCAMRALMILRTYKGYTKRVGRQQVSSMILINAVKRISPDFSILKEARREVLEDLMDVENAQKVMEGIEKGNIKIKEISTTVPSPFTFNLIAQGISDILKIEDRVEFLRRMHKNVLAKIGMKKVVES